MIIIMVSFTDQKWDGTSRCPKARCSHQELAGRQQELQEALAALEAEKQKASASES